MILIVCAIFMAYCFIMCICYERAVSIIIKYTHLFLNINITIMIFIAPIDCVVDLIEKGRKRFLLSLLYSDIYSFLFKSLLQI